jgi:molybdopterin/thiamine biosynthesis adenylyltransferase
LGSIIAELSLRLGFENFFIADGDNVEISNLNRQAFNLNDEGNKKTSSLEKRLLGINPNAKINVLSNYIKSEDDLSEILNNGDFLINTIDVGELYFKLIEKALYSNTSVILPFNVGFGTLVFLILPEHINYWLKNKENLNNIKNDLDFLMYFFRSKMDIVPDYIKNNLNFFSNGIEQNGYYPQIGIGSFTSAALVNTILISIAFEENFKQPMFFYSDFRNSIRGIWQ